MRTNERKQEERQAAQFKQSKKYKKGKSMTTRNTQNRRTQIVSRKTKCKNVKLGDIRPNKTIRIGELKEGKKYKALKNSIETHGVITPIVVKKNEDDTYAIIDGTRRYLAAEELGYKKLKVTIYEEIENPEDVLGLVANANQRALTPIELGFAYRRLIKNGVYNSNRELAKALGISESSVGAKIKNLEMDKHIIEELLEGNGINDQKILKAIRGIEKVDENGESEKQRAAYEHIIANSLGRKDALAYIKTLRMPELVSDRTVRLSEGNVIDLHIDTSIFDEKNKRKIQELVAQIEALQQEAVAT